MASHRLAILAFVGPEATLVFNGYKVNPENPYTTIVSQVRREYKGDNTSAAVRAFALKMLGKSAEHAVAREVETGLYSIEVSTPDEKPAKGK